MANDFIVTQLDGAVGIARLNRPDVLNALNMKLMEQLIETLSKFDDDPSIRCIVLTGNEKAFAAGADIKEMSKASLVDMYERNNLARWECIRRVRKPIIAAVSGYCLGGGCELAMLCDMIIAAESAKFGQPEINIGVIPGAGRAAVRGRREGGHRTGAICGRPRSARESIPNRR